MSWSTVPRIDSEQLLVVADRLPDLPLFVLDAAQTEVDIRLLLGIAPAESRQYLLVVGQGGRPVLQLERTIRDAANGFLVSEVQPVRGLVGFERPIELAQSSQHLALQ